MTAEEYLVELCKEKDERIKALESTIIDQQEMLKEDNKLFDALREIFNDKDTETEFDDEYIKMYLPVYMYASKRAVLYEKLKLIDKVFMIKHKGED